MSAATAECKGEGGSMFGLIVGQYIGLLRAGFRLVEVRHPVEIQSLAKEMFGKLLNPEVDSN